MVILRKIGAGYTQFIDDFLLKKILNDVDLVEISSKKNLFLFSHRTSTYYLKLYTLFAHALSKKGYPSCFLFRDYLLERYYPKIEKISEKIDFSNIPFTNNFKVGSYFPKLSIDGLKISNSLIEEIPTIKITNEKESKLKFDWEIDFQKNLIKTQDINFFQIIQNTLRTIYKRYNIDFSDKKVISLSKEMIKSCDLLIYYFLKLKKYSKIRDLKIKIVGWDTDYLPNGVFKILCDFKSKNRDIEYIDFSRGYAKYFGHHHHESFLILSNLTYSGNENIMVLNSKEFIELSKNYNARNAFSEIKKVFSKDEKSGLKPNQKRIVDLIYDYKSSNKKIFVLFSHLFYDTPWEDSSPSFENMCEWILKTVDFFKKRNDFLLLKPHPTEFLRKPSETLSYFIKNEAVKLSDNIFLLDPKIFSLNKIVDYIDCGLVWRSSVGLELPLYNKPSIIAGCPPYKILDFYYSKDKEDYFNMIENVKDLYVKDKQKLNAAKYILGLKNKHKYIGIMSYNKKIKRNYFINTLLEKYIMCGDSNINYFIKESLK